MTSPAASSPRTQRVLVAVDFSGASHEALAWAVDYATHRPCELHLVHVVEDAWTQAFSEALQEQVDKEIWAVTQKAQAELERLAQGDPLRDRIGPVTHHVGRGRPAAEIVKAAGRIGAELVVVGAQGRGGLPALLLGSVAERVVREAPCPVVAVRAPQATPPG